MAVKEKVELIPALKGQDFKEGDIVKASAFVKEVVNDVDTRYGLKDIMHFEDGDSIFVNVETNNNMVEAYGKEDTLWRGKPVRLVCKKDTKYSKLMLVAEALLNTKV